MLLHIAEKCAILILFLAGSRVKRAFQNGKYAMKAAALRPMLIGRLFCTPFGVFLLWEVFFMSKKRFNTRALVFAGVCVALGVVLPMAFHSLPDGGRVFLPMHIPVLLCGLLCGPWYGLGCGVLAPLLSHFITGMPMAAALPGMLCELAAYGCISGLVSRLVKTKNPVGGVYIPLVCAMLGGRVVAGLVNGFIFQAGSYSLQAWVAGSFVTALPGIAVQLVLLPVLVLALKRAGIKPVQS